MFNSRRQKREYERQTTSKECWEDLFNLAVVMTKSKNKIKQNKDLLDDFENVLKGYLSQKRSKKHKALDIYKSYKNYMINSGNIEYGVQSVLMCAQKRM